MLMPITLCELIFCSNRDMTIHIFIIIVNISILSDGLYSYLHHTTCNPVQVLVCNVSLFMDLKFKFNSFRSARYKKCVKLALCDIRTSTKCVHCENGRLISCVNATERVKTLTVVIIFPSL